MLEAFLVAANNLEDVYQVPTVAGPQISIVVAGATGFALPKQNDFVVVLVLREASALFSACSGNVDESDLRKSCEPTVRADMEDRLDFTYRRFPSSIHRWSNSGRRAWSNSTVDSARDSV